MSTTDTVRDIAEPLAERAGASVYDVTFKGGSLVVALSRPGGIDLDTLSDVSRELGARLDEDDVVGGSYTLEVTSPGLERPLRTAAHFRGAVGESVTLRTLPDAAVADGERRIRGTIVASDDDSVTVRLEDGDEERTVAIDAIERARTTFTWEATPKPGGPKTTKHKKNQEARP